MNRKENLTSFHQLLLSSCSLITLLSVHQGQASIVSEEEKNIILPAGLPQKTQKTQSIKNVDYQRSF